MSILDLLKEPTKTVKFKGADLTVRKLPTRVVIELSQAAGKHEDADNFKRNIDMMSLILVNGVEEFDESHIDIIRDASQDLFSELADLQTEVMDFSGLGVKDSEE